MIAIEWFKYLEHWRSFYEKHGHSWRFRHGRRQSWLHWHLGWQHCCGGTLQRCRPHRPLRRGRGRSWPREPSGRKRPCLRKKDSNIKINLRRNIIFSWHQHACTWLGMQLKWRHEMCHSIRSISLLKISINDKLMVVSGFSFYQNVICCLN